MQRRSNPFFARPCLVSSHTELIGKALWGRSVRSKILPAKPGTPCGRLQEKRNTLPLRESAIGNSKAGPAHPSAFVSNVYLEMAGEYPLHMPVNIHGPQTRPGGTFNKRVNDELLASVAELKRRDGGPLTVGSSGSHDLLPLLSNPGRGLGAGWSACCRMNLFAGDSFRVRISASADSTLGKIVARVWGPRVHR